jgi:hypothetical protein
VHALHHVCKERQAAVVHMPPGEVQVEASANRPPAALAEYLLKATISRL